MLRWIIAVVLILGVAGTLGACNTLEGIGKDITAVGRALNKSVQ
jgi:predicted small secreted protein